MSLFEAFRRKKKTPKPATRTQLMEALITNRSNQNKGKGEKYWESVVTVVEQQLNIKLEK